MLLLQPFTDLPPLASRYALHCLLCENDSGPFTFLPAGVIEALSVEGTGEALKKKRVLFSGFSVLSGQAATPCEASLVSRLLQLSAASSKPHLPLPSASLDSS